MKTTSFSRSIFFFVFLFTILVSPPIALSQSSGRAAITGKVLDPDGRAVARAHVDLLSGLNPIDARETSADGQFRFDGLLPGTYSLVANSSGFSTLSTDVDLQSGADRSIDLRLEVSAVEEHVVVSATPGGALATQVGSSVSVITRQDIEDEGVQNIYEALRDIPGVNV